MNWHDTSNFKAVHERCGVEVAGLLIPIPRRVFLFFYLRYVEALREDTKRACENMDFDTIVRAPPFRKTRLRSRVTLTER